MPDLLSFVLLPAATTFSEVAFQGSSGLSIFYSADYVSPMAVIQHSANAFHHIHNRQFHNLQMSAAYSLIQLLIDFLSVYN